MNALNRDYFRGQLYYADLDPTFGHEQRGYRPVLILQNDTGNIYSPTVIVTTASRRIGKRPHLPTHVALDHVDGLDSPSQFQLENLRTLDKRRLKRYIGALTEEQMEKIDEALRISLYLDDEDVLPVTMEAP